MKKSVSAKKLAEGISLHQKGSIKQAETIYQSILSNDPNNYEALHYLGVIALQSDQNEEAISKISKAIAIKPDYFEAHTNISIPYKKLGQYKRALNSLNTAIRLNKNHAEAYYNRGNLKKDYGQLSDAIEDYDKTIKINPRHSKAYFNRASCYQDLTSLEPSISDWLKAIELDPMLVASYLCIGEKLGDHGRDKEAAEYLYKFLESEPENCQALYILYELFKRNRLTNEAEITLSKIELINPKHHCIKGFILLDQMHKCYWDEYDTRLSELIRGIEMGESLLTAFISAIIFRSLSHHKKVTEIYSKNTFQKIDLLEKTNKNLNNKKIKIGYYSGDIYNHATCILMAEVFEMHDTGKFEIYIFSFGPIKNDEMALRIKSACKNFHEVHNLTDKKIAELSNNLGIDIAVDLKGYTKDSRPNIFTYRAAPIQVNYLGFPGTMGNEKIDYIIADERIIPKEYRELYTEKIAYLPNSYQPNDSKKKVEDCGFSKLDLGIPINSFVFCCFNSNYKITPHIFNIWMRILDKVDNSILWLLVESKEAQDNLHKEAHLRGIDKKRIIFATRLDHPMHLDRHRFADLFLDTWPCNAHTTANDALWAGLPVLTLNGETFASRVCTSLLFAVGLPELITTNAQDYENLAVELAQDKAKLDFIKGKLIKNKHETPLFDNLKYTKDIERIYEQMYLNHQKQLPPDHIFI
jgi:predicted O-linked N-acetylglucosamine transferase (SPINDLY family)